MIGDAAFLFAELVFLFLSVSFVLGLARRRMGNERLRRWMGGRPLVAALKGIGIGFITPFCTYSAIPMLVGLRQAGVRPAGYVAFIVAAPVLDPILFGALVLIVGIEAAIVYLTVAFAAALALAFIAERADMSRYLKPLPAALVTPGAEPVLVEDVGCDRESACDEPADDWGGWSEESRAAGRASLALLRSMSLLIVAGVAVGVAITALVPAEAAAELTGGNGIFAVPIAAALGTPLYINTELFVPIADSLKVAGVSTGAVVALTIAGAGANIPEFVILGRLVEAKVLSVFIGYVFVVAMVGGALASLIVG